MRGLNQAIASSWDAPLILDVMILKVKVGLRCVQGR